MSQKDIGSFIDRTYKVVRQDLINRFKDAGVDLTPEQWVILAKLDKKDMYQTDLANHSYRDKPTVSRIVDLLAKKNLVVRVQDEYDGRKFLVTLTEVGKEVVRNAYPAVEDSRNLGWTNLTDKEYDSLISILDKIFINYSENK